MYLLVNLYENNEIRNYVNVPEMKTNKEIDDWIDKNVTTNPHISWYTSAEPFKFCNYIVDSDEIKAIPSAYIY